MRHRAGGMGTILVARRIKPDLAPLEARDDLSAPFVEKIVRNGAGHMPPLSRAEVSDGQMSAIADYLAAPNRFRDE